MSKLHAKNIKKFRNFNEIFVFQEGPHSTLPEDEFFDAVESGLDKIEEDRQLRVKLKYQSQHSQISQPITVLPQTVNISEDFGTGSQAKSHPLWPNVSILLLFHLFIYM